MDKKAALTKLISKLKEDTEVENIWVLRKGEKVNLGLINHYKLHNQIPNKWFDWERCAGAKIMIIGQDWGPYSVLSQMISDFDEGKKEDNEYYREFLFRDFSSRTEKFILKAVETTYKDKFATDFPKEGWDKIFFTMSVLFTRQGKHFRGNHNFDPQKSFDLSYKYVTEQIKIIQPELIIPLGNMAFEVVKRYFNLSYNKPKISKIVEELDGKYFIRSGNTKILPNYHPASHVDPKIQKLIWSKMWETVKL